MGMHVFTNSANACSSRQIAQLTGASDSLSAAKDTLKHMDLNACIKLALTNATEVLKGQNAVEMAGVQVLASYGQYLPDLTFGAGYNYSMGKTDLTASVPTLIQTDRSGFNYQLVSTLNLFTGLATRSAFRAALATKKAAELTLERAKQQIAFDITQSYLQVELDKRILAFARQNLTTSLKRENQLQELTDLGRKSKSDLYQQQAETSSDKLFLITAENKLRKDKILLFKKLRIDNSEKYNLDDVNTQDPSLTAQLDNEQTLVEKALNQRSDLKSSQLNLDISQLNITKVKSGHLPKVFLNYGLYSAGAYYYNLYINDVNAMPATQPNLSNQLFGQVNGLIALNASWNLFDKNVTRSNIQQNKLIYDNARIDNEDLKIAIKTDIQQAIGDYKAALQLLETATQGVKAAQASFDTMNGRYLQGSANFIDLETAQTTLLQANEAYTQSLINLMLQKAVIDLYTGK